MGHFQRSSMDSVAIPVALSIDHFSLRAQRGFYEGQEFECGQSRWKLVVYSEDPLYGEFLDVRLRRCDFDGSDRFVVVKLSVVDCRGSRWFSREKKLCFANREDTQKVLTVSPRDLFDRVLPPEATPSFDEVLYRLNKRRLLPNDTLTLWGEVTVSRETETSFEDEEDFRRSLVVEPRWFGWVEPMTYHVIRMVKIAWVLAQLAFRYILLPFLVYVLWPSVAFVVKKLYDYMAAEVKGRVERWMAPPRPHGRKRSPHYSDQDLEILPYGERNQNVVCYQTEKYTYLVKRMPNGMFERQVKQYNDNYKPKKRYIHG